MKSFLFLILLLSDKDEEPDRWFDGPVKAISFELLLFLIGFIISLFLIVFWVKKIGQRKAE